MKDKKKKLTFTKFIEGVAALFFLGFCPFWILAIIHTQRDYQAMIVHVLVWMGFMWVLARKNQEEGSQ